MFVDIQVSLFPNVGTAETTILEFVNSGNLRSEYGPFEELSCGDNFWWYASDDNLWYVIFIRKNALVEVSTSYIEEKRYDDILSLAKQIDQDLIDGASYVIMSDNVQFPEVTGVEIAQSKLKLDDRASIEVSAFDPLNTELLYKGDIFSGPVDGQNNKLQFRVTEVSAPLGEPFEGTHTFYVWVVNELNMHSYKYPVKLTFTIPTAVDKDDTLETPAVFTLSQNRPNPFNPATVIPFTLREDGHVRLTVYGLLGRELTTLADGPMTAGAHELTWDGRTGDGVPCASGVYIYRLETGDSSENGRMTLVR